ncbi:LysR family transcriptional regulator substrate-binding protein [Collimonas pratensis]|uniref:LysR family transcriptional regulator substrate-binding protein n=1 Tax=Collimonas pratensis TaxID=279113 RepID=UPI001F11321E
MAASGECGRLRIDAHALIPHGFLAKLIEQYLEDHLSIEIEMTEGTARDALVQLRADRLDIAFVAGTPELPDCHSRRYGSNRSSRRCRSGISSRTDPLYRCWSASSPRPNARLSTNIRATS